MSSRKELFDKRSIRFADDSFAGSAKEREREKEKHKKREESSEDEDEEEGAPTGPISSEDEEDDDEAESSDDEEKVKYTRRSKVNGGRQEKQQVKKDDTQSFFRRNYHYIFGIIVVLIIIAVVYYFFGYRPAITEREKQENEQLKQYIEEEKGKAVEEFKAHLLHRYPQIARIVNSPQFPNPIQSKPTEDELDRRIRESEQAASEVVPSAAAKKPDVPSVSIPIPEAAKEEQPPAKTDAADTAGLVI